MERRAARVALVCCVILLAALTPVLAALSQDTIDVARAQVPGPICEIEPDLPECPDETASASASPSESAGASATASATASTSSSPTSSGSPSGSACPSSSPGSSSPSACPPRSASASASRSPSGSPSGSPAQQTRTITLFATEGKVRAGEDVDFAGQIFSQGANCGGQDQFVRLQRRVAGSDVFEDLRSTLTNAEGRYAFNEVEVEQNADYKAVAPSHDNCATAESSTVTVLASARVSIRVNDKTPKRGSNVRISGGVRPGDPGSKVRLQQRRGGGWETVLGDRLDRRSRYGFVFEATGPKTQRYRVRWLGSEQNEPGTSRELTLKLHK